MASSFKSLRVWQDAMGFTVNVYHATAQFPRHELYGLTQQLRRAAVSVPSNIAEDKGTAPTGSSRISCSTRVDRSWRCKRNL